jgi:hypothetical protein
VAVRRGLTSVMLAVFVSTTGTNRQYHIISTSSSNSNITKLRLVPTALRVIPARRKLSFACLAEYHLPHDRHFLQIYLASGLSASKQTLRLHPHPNQVCLLAWRSRTLSRACNCMHTGVSNALASTSNHCYLSPCALYSVKS